MKYIITNNPDKFLDTHVYSIVPISKLIEYLTHQTEVGLDAETYGFDPHTKKMMSLQLGDFNDQYLVDCESVDISVLKLFLETRLIIGQNLKFDMKFLFKHGIYLRKIYDTFVCEKVLNCGIDYIRAGLDALCERYCGVIMDKSIRVDIPTEGLTLRVINYAFDDVKYLGKIKELQEEKAQKEDLGGVFNLENRFTPCLAYIEYCGFKLDSDKWKAKMKSDLELKLKLREDLDRYVTSNSPFKFIDTQFDMFKEELECDINWDSPKQVAEFLEFLGIDCTVKSGGVTKKSVDASVIGKYRKEYSIVNTYIEYKQAEKVITTYGESFLGQININTGRIHSDFKQILDTGRISSGNKQTNSPNFQNIPSDPETRSCFVAEEGNTLIISDYSAQEQVVLANNSMDPNLLDFYDNGLSDMHAFIAGKMYPELEGLSLEDIKKNHKDKRQIAKITGFTINYGGEGSTIAADLNIPKEEGDAIYNSYFVAFPGLRSYFDSAKQQGIRDGYIFISPITKRKSYLSFFDKYKALAGMMTKNYWIRYRKLKETGGPEFEIEKSLVKEYFYYQGIIERKSLNFPIQGQSAEITKISCVYIYDYILNNNLFGIVKFVNTVHDENVLECPLELSDPIAKVTEESMNKAALIFCKRVPLTATPDINLYWRK